MADTPPCPVCGSQVRRTLPADAAPFLRARCRMSEQVEVRSNFCDACEHVFFTPFLDQEQLDLIYDDYVGEEYVRLRTIHEPGYDNKQRYFRGEARTARSTFYQTFLADFRNLTGLVVDYGGGQGVSSRYAFPDAEIVVVEHDYEKKGVDLDGLVARADFLLCAHVFEHTPQPFEILSRVTRNLRDGAFVYVELPKEYPGALGDAFEALEAQQTAGEPFAPQPLLRMHEHIAHFSKRSAQALMRRCGITPYEVHHSGSNIIAVLGQALGEREPAPLPTPRFPRRYAPLAAGRSLDFSRVPGLERYLRHGWRAPENGFAWTQGRRAQLAIPPGFDARHGVIARLTVSPLVQAPAHPLQRVAFSGAAGPIAEVGVSHPGEIVVHAPAAALAGTPPCLDLELLDATTPKALGLSDDASILALQLHGLRLDPVLALGDGEVGETGQGGQATAALLRGWRPPEPGLSWTSGLEAEIVVAPDFQAEAIDCVLVVSPLLKPGTLEGQRLMVEGGDQPVSQTIAAAHQSVIVPVGRAVDRDGVVHLRLSTPDATTLRALELGADDSLLALQLHSISLRARRGST